MNVQCTGLPGKPCKTVILAEYAKVPPFSLFSGEGKKKLALTREKILATAVCDDCARKYPRAVGIARMYPLLSALAQVEVRKVVPAAASLGELLQTSSILKGSRAAAVARIRNEKDDRRRRSAEQAARFIDAAQRTSQVAA